MVLKYLNCIKLPISLIVLCGVKGSENGTSSKQCFYAFLLEQVRPANAEVGGEGVADEHILLYVCAVPLPSPPTKPADFILLHATPQQKFQHQPNGVGLKTVTLVTNPTPKCYNSKNIGGSMCIYIYIYTCL